MEGRKQRSIHIYIGGNVQRDLIIGAEGSTRLFHADNVEAGDEQWRSKVEIVCHERLQNPWPIVLYTKIVLIVCPDGHVPCHLHRRAIAKHK